MRVEVIAQLFRNRAVCECGWHGASRLSRGGAVVDGYLHIASHPSEMEQLAPTQIRAAS